MTDRADAATVMNRRRMILFDDDVLTVPRREIPAALRAAETLRVNRAGTGGLKRIIGQLEPGSADE